MKRLRKIVLLASVATLPAVMMSFETANTKHSEVILSGIKNSSQTFDEVEGQSDLGITGIAVVTNDNAPFIVTKIVTETAAYSADLSRMNETEIAKVLNKYN